MGVTFSVGVMHAPWARDRVPYVTRIRREMQRAGVPVTVVEDKTRAGCWPTARRALLAIPGGVTHHMLMQDDVIMCDLFADYVKAAIEANPNQMISFYCPFKTLEGATVSWGVMYGRAYTYALIMPVRMARGVVAFGDTIKVSDADDWRVSLYADKHGLGCWTTYPNLIQHSNIKSVMGHSSAVLKRHTNSFQQSPGVIDWSLGLDSPLVVIKTKSRT